MASLASVRCNPDGTFGSAVWTNLSDPGLQAPLTADAVEGNQVVGIGLVSSGIISYQATVNTGFQLSNVISGNGGNGIGRLWCRRRHDRDEQHRHGFQRHAQTR